MASINKILNNVLHGQNNFCALCFKTDQNNVFHDEINIRMAENEEIIPLSDVLQSVFGNKVHAYLSSFEKICEDCLNLIIGIYIYIQSCHNNAMSLMQAIHELNDSLNCTKDNNDKSKSLYVGVNLQNFKCNLTYDFKKIDSMKKALRRYKTLQNTKKILQKPKVTKPAKKSVKKPPKPKQKKKKNKTCIKTKDMLLDPNDAEPKCKECLKPYPNVLNLRGHYLRLHAPKRFKCTKCPRLYSTPALLNNHISAEHCEIICSECGKKFTNKATFLKHELTHHLQIICPDCGRNYKSSVTFRKHIDSNVCKQDRRASPSDAQYTCDYCKKKYTQKMSLRVHIQYYHGDYKAHVCKWCNKKFWAQSRLKAHIVKHTKEKNFVCSVCQRKFVTKESLLYHTRLHTGEKPYKCTQCESRFLSASRRAYHLKTYHLQGKIECEICHAKFMTSTYLKRHKEYHKEYQTEQNESTVETANDNVQNHQKKKSKTKKLDENNPLLMQSMSPQEKNSATVAAEPPQIAATKNACSILRKKSLR